jgi:outer membrane protein OmpA-like peptidoglycan-associated protein
VILALTALASAATPELDIDGYAALFLPSAEHELYDPFDSQFRPLSPAPALGGRATWLFIPQLGVEGDAEVALSSVEGGGSAALGAWGVQGIAALPGVFGDVTPLATLGVGDLAVQSATSAVGSDLDAALRWGVGARIRLAPRNALRLDFRDHLSAHHGVLHEPAQNFEITLGIVHTLRGGEPKDPDNDGFTGRSDACPEERETVNGWKDDDGCPDELASVKVAVHDPRGHPLESATVLFDGKKVGETDATGVVLVDGLMPGTRVGRIDVTPPEESALEPAANPDPIDLVEGKIDLVMQTDWQVGATHIRIHDAQGGRIDGRVEFRGAAPPPFLDTGLDGEAYFALPPGEWTLFVSAPDLGVEWLPLSIAPDDRTLRELDVVLGPVVVLTTKEEVVLLEDVQFDSDKATIKPESLPLVHQIATTLSQHSEIARVELQGHTDDKGSNRYNQGLSQERVTTIMAFLIQQGVAPERLTSVGYGEACPLVPNRTEADRAANRRVQIFIIDPVPSDGIPCHPGVPARRARPTRVITQGQ